MQVMSPAGLLTETTSWQYLPLSMRKHWPDCTIAVWLTFAHQEEAPKDRNLRRSGFLDKRPQLHLKSASNR
jgi:hypothetical protein